jgi:hypothetical protein
MIDRHQYSEFDIKLVLRTEHAAFVYSMSDTRPVLTYTESQLLLPVLATLFILEGAFVAILAHADTCLAVKFLNQHIAFLSLFQDGVLYGVLHSLLAVKI